MTEEMLNALADLDHTLSSFQWAGPGNTDNWEPGEEVDYDALAADVINAAIEVVRVYRAESVM